jgi:hypothetical protein
MKEGPLRKLAVNSLGTVPSITALESMSEAMCIRTRLRAISLKRAIYGTYHHVSQQHLKRYLAEFDFRYNERSALGVEDAERTTKVLSGIVGMRLTYLDSSAW